MFKGRKAFDEIHKRQQKRIGILGYAYYRGDPGILQRLERLEKLEAKLDKLEAKLDKLQGIVNEVVDKVYEEAKSEGTNPSGHFADS